MRTGRIVVGTDGTEPSRAAVRWAAREAVDRGARLAIVHAFDWDWESARYDSGSEYLDVARQLADAVTAAAVDQARAAAPAVQVEADAFIGSPVTRLLDSAADAELVVLGSRGRGGVASLLLGSVGQRLATHAPCPVAVVRGGNDVVDGPVVVGVDDSPAIDLVLATAFDMAARRRAALAVIRTYPGTSERDAAERQHLDEQLAPWREKYPDVPVETRLSQKTAAVALTDASPGAQLVIVGSRGHGALAVALLGSTGRHLLQHAACPVLVVRHPVCPEDRPDRPKDLLESVRRHLPPLVPRR